MRAESSGDAEAAHPLDDVDEAAPGARDRRELVDDEQDALGERLAPDGPLGELLDEEAGEVAGLVLEPQPVEEEVGAVELVEGDPPLERAADGGEEGGVAGTDPVQLPALERRDLERAAREPRGCRPSRGSRRSRLSSSPESSGGPAGASQARRIVLTARSR